MWGELEVATITYRSSCGGTYRIVLFVVLLQVLVVPVKVMAVAVVVAPARSEQPRHIWTNLHVAETDECAY